MAETLAIDGSCAVRPPGVPEGSQCVLTDWGANGYPAHWVYREPEVPQSPDPAEKQEDDGCATCKGAKQSIKRTTRYGPFYTTATTPLDGGPTTYGGGVGNAIGYGSASQLCTSYGQSPGITSTVSGSLFGSSATSVQSFGAPFDDAAHSFQVCTPAPGSAPSISPGVSVGFGGVQ